jgi:hypothetical protein
MYPLNHIIIMPEGRMEIIINILPSLESLSRLGGEGRGGLQEGMRDAPEIDCHQLSVCFAPVMPKSCKLVLTFTIQVSVKVVIISSDRHSD